MHRDMVRDWFGARFDELHPMLQMLHVSGGALQGTIQVVHGKGLAGHLGRRLAKRLNVPGDGRHDFSVKISHRSDGLHWDRCFDHSTEMKSTFRPVGVIDDGYWVEETGSLKMRLTVDIIDGGWYWRCLSLRVLGVPFPTWILPKSRAYKTIENGSYRFFVGFSAPLLGDLISYSGLLEVDPPTRTVPSASVKN